MNTRTTFVTVAIGAVLLIGGFSPLEAGEPLEASRLAKGITGTYWGQLDLTALNPASPRIESVGLYLDPFGGVFLTSEHEPGNLEAAGIGTWEHLGGGLIGIGVLSYRLPFTAAPDGTIVSDGGPVLKLGGTVSRDGNRGLVGSLTLSINDTPIVDGLPASFDRLTVADFPGASGER